MSDDNDYYQKYRGKCKEFSEQLVSQDSSLTLVRGYYYCPHWGQQPHWWVKDANGKIIDPTKDQFPSRGNGEYVEFDGNVNCANCDKQLKEDEAQFYGNYAYCSDTCIMRHVGL